MNNHLHLILCCKEPFRLSDVLRDFKKYAATQIVQAIKDNPGESRKGWLLWLFEPKDEICFWQPDKHAKEITDREFFREKLEYIHQNPVRARLVDREESWVYSSAGDFSKINRVLELSYFD